MKSKSIFLLLSIAFSLSAMEDIQENPKEESDQEQTQVKEKEKLKVTYRMRNKDNIKLAQSLKDFFMNLFYNQHDNPKIDIREFKSNKKRTFKIFVPEKEYQELEAYFKTIERRSEKAQRITKNLSLLKKIKNDYDTKTKDKTKLTHKDIERIEKWPQSLKELAVRISKFPPTPPEPSQKSPSYQNNSYQGNPRIAHWSLY